MTWIGSDGVLGGVADDASAARVRNAAADPDTAVVSLLSRREAMVACLEALRDVDAVMVACSDRDLAALAGELAELRALAGAGLVTATAEAEARGVTSDSQYASTAAWVADAAWHSRREASTIAKAAALFRQADYEPVTHAVRATEVDLPSAVACGQEFTKLAPDLTDAARPLVLEHMLDLAAEHGPVGVRRLKDEILARYGTKGTFEEQCERRRRHIELSVGRQTDAGLWDYRLTLDGESRAVLEAAIGPGSAPKPAKAAVHATPGSPPLAPVRDLRPAGRRRGEALIDALRRSVSAAEQGRPGPSPKAILTLTMDYRDLAGGLHRHSDAGRADAGRADAGSEPTTPGAATVLGSLAGGELVSPESVRRLACDAGIIPVVLGSRGEILDQGLMERLFTPGQVRALWRRDRHCTFPDCDIPAAWCDAHHLVHWADGGETSLSNAALLCARHHTVVHRDQLAGSVSTSDAADSPHSVAANAAPSAAPMTLAWTPAAPPGTGKRNHARSRRTEIAPTVGVAWDLRPGSYKTVVPRAPDERLTA